MLRFLLFGILFYWGYRLLNFLLIAPRLKRYAAEQQRTSGDDALVSCVRCHTRVPRQLMVQRTSGLYCSVSCADS
ncbi:MAG: hypothetical protein HQL75_02565 [Magnetococcales bacterium]|nr:hypothetical protein [Magnetococcales bacterium]